MSVLGFRRGRCRVKLIPGGSATNGRWSISHQPRRPAAAAREIGAVVTAEEHTVIGGLGGAVTEALAKRWPVPVVRVGIADCFTESGPYFDLLDRHGCAVADVLAGARRALALKGQRSS